MIRKTGLIIFILSLILIGVDAHEFWLQADRLYLKIGERCTIRFMVGENFMGEPWDLKKHKIEKLDLHQAGTTMNIMDSVRLDQSVLRLTFKDAGTRMIAMQSNAAYIGLDGEKFNEYLKEDGLDDIYDLRKSTNTLQKPSRELYSRHTKLLLSVGEKSDDTFKKILGFPIEIIPERNPVTLKKGDRQKFKVLFNGQPLFGGKVRLWNRYDNRTTIQNIYTGQDGMIDMSISNPGSWMISIVKMVPSKDPKADWQSYWGSLVFEINK